MVGKLDMGHARALLGLASAQQITAAEQIVQKSLSVREAEQLVKRLSEETPKTVKPAEKDKDVLRLQEDLAEKIGADVQIDTAKNGAGTVKIRYASLDQLDGIIARLSSH